MEGPLDYSRLFRSAWGKGDAVVNVEHDMEYSDDLVDELLSCDHELCAYPYIVYPRRHHSFVYGAQWRGDYVEEGQAFATFSAIGFAKYEATVQDPLPEVTWNQVEMAIHDRVVHGKRLWHLHWPAVQHFHDYTQEPYYRGDR